MSFEEQLHQMYPAADAIPTQYQLPAEVHQREYLSGGEMKPWNGDVHTVLSPICIQTPEGLQRKVIGSYPLGGQEEAIAAMDAALLAYNDGRGEWPTMPVAERITCMEKFTGKMIEKKEEVVKLI